MATWYNPPGPYIGGRQPYDPGWRVTPPQTTQNPPFGQVLRLKPWMETAIRSWVPPAPVYLGGKQPYDPGRRVTPPINGPVASQPPFGEQERLKPWLLTVLQSWVPSPAYYNPLRRVLPTTPAATYVPPPADPWLNTVLHAWQQPFIYRNQPELIVQSAPAASYVPPPEQWLTGVIQQWQPTWRAFQQPEWQPIPDQPQPFTRIQPSQSGQTWQTVNSWSLSVVTFNGAISGIEPPPPPPPVIDNPQPKSDAVFNSIIQAWIPPAPMPVQLPQEQEISGPVAADPPPHTSLALLYSLTNWANNIVIPISLPQLAGASLIAPTVDDPNPKARWQQPALAWWYQPWTYRQARPSVAFLPPPVVDDPQPQNDTWQQIVAQSWVPPFRYPYTPTELVFPGPIPDAPVPNAAWQQQALAWWYIPWIYPQTLAPIAAAIPQPDNPPASTKTLLLLLAQSWVPGPPQPYQLHQLFQIPSFVPDNPPIVGTEWLNTVIAAWQPPPPLPHQLPQQIVVPGEEPPVPPEPPVGPSGGGPAWYYRYGKCDEDDEECYERAEEFLEELGEEEKRKLESLVQKAVIAVKEDKPAQFKTARRVFTTEVAKVSGIVKADIAAIWRVEVEHRIMEEEEEMTILLAYF